MNSLILPPLLIAFLSPLTYGLVNLIDKYIVTKKIHSPSSYTVVVGLTHIIIGAIIASFLSWDGFTSSDLMLCTIVGALYGLQLLIYYVVFSEEDAANAVGLDHTYPLVVAVLAYTYLGESTGIAGYGGLALILAGLILLSQRMLQVRPNVRLGLLAAMICTTGVYEFAIKVSTISVPPLHTLALNSIVAGSVVCLLLLRRKTRRMLGAELRNIGWAFTSESLTVIAILCIIGAMGAFPAVLASAVTALQPLVVLIGERILSYWHHEITRDKLLRPKLAAILLVILGTLVMLVDHVVWGEN